MVTWAESFQMIYDLFIRYTFGSLELAFLGSFLIIAMIGYKLHVSADGWVLILGGYGYAASILFLPSFAFVPIIAISLGFLIYLLVKRLVR